MQDSDYIPTQQESWEDKHLDSILRGREQSLLEQFNTARYARDVPAGYIVVSEATRYGDEPLWTVEDVEAWADYANTNSESGFFVDGRPVARGGSRGHTKTLKGLIRSTLVPTMPIREAVTDYLKRSEGTFTDLAIAATNQLKRLGIDSDAWVPRAGQELLHELGMRVSTHNTGSGSTVRSFMSCTGAAAVALSIGIPPIEIGA